jgi:hypothetical protein
MNMLMVSSFREVVALWGSPDALAADIGAGIAAARKWPQRDNIPAEWWLPILQTEVARGAGLTAEVLTALAAREPVEARV